jgi:chromosome segregation ATPase
MHMMLIAWLLVATPTLAVQQPPPTQLESKKQQAENVRKALDACKADAKAIKAQFAKLVGSKKTGAEVQGDVRVGLRKWWEHTLGLEKSVAAWGERPKARQRLKDLVAQVAGLKAAVDGLDKNAEVSKGKLDALNRQQQSVGMKQNEVSGLLDRTGHP